MGSTMQEYLAPLWGKRVAVLGIGVSDTPLIKMLLQANIEAVAYDKRRRGDFGSQAEELGSLGAELRLGPDYLDRLDHDMIFRTPDLRPDVSQLLAARERGGTITSEMEIFSQVCPCKATAVTGSGGKTITATIIAELLKAMGWSVCVGGDIGKPLLPDMDRMVPEGVAVLELSSPQSMIMEQSLDIAMVANLTPNHLDVYRSMEEYIATKGNIFTRQEADGLLILNQDNGITHGFTASTHGRVTRFSRREELEQGISARDGVIWVHNAMYGRPALYLENILLPGEHSIESYMMIIGAPDGLVPDQVVRGFTVKFAGVEHRVELVRTRNGMRYYSGSTASSPSRTIAGLRSFHRKVVLIAGGHDKHIPFDVFGSEVAEHAKALVLTGDTVSKLRQAAGQAPGYNPTALPVVEYKDFEVVVLAACRLARPGGVVSLLPACTFSDRFRNFMERGAAFKRIICGLERGYGCRRARPPVPCSGIRRKE